MLGTYLELHKILVNCTLLYTSPDLNYPSEVLQKCSYYSTELSRGYLSRYLSHFSG